ncbi:hypothetical protein SSX86_030282 [Deinandra increscens subsp. villosa]|uniref:Pectinesterase inhibitor domain-containing protein n=1 Tax=Deinandra increscens subsp. villosa TaxID=3103831 RepID=A0AAP0C7E1_9ASTR
MALSKRTLTLIFVFAFLFLLIQCSKATSDDETPSPAPASKEDEEDESSPAPSPAEEEEEDDDDEDDDDADDDERQRQKEKESTPNSSLSSGGGAGAAADSPTSSAESPMSMTELLELSLPEIGVQKVVNGPLTDGAKVSTKQLEGIEHKIEEFKTILTKREANPGSDATKKCLNQCQGNLDDAVDGVKKGIESINKQDLSKANIDISGVATDIETCNDCFIEADGEDKEINAFNVWIKGVTKECLSNLK